MLRNDYRRALIMLRSLRQGVSGYVRLERRTLMGSMQFTVNGAGQDEALYALLLYEQSGLWRACLLDRLGQPRYGQCGAVCRFDPRNICGRALEDYALVAVASVKEDVCELLLAGYLNGTVLTDWQQVKQAACQAVAAGRADSAPRGETIAPALAELQNPAPPIPAISVNEAREADVNAASEAEEKADKEAMPGAEAEPGSEGAGEANETQSEPNAEDQPAPDEFDLPAPGSSEEPQAEAAPDEFDAPAQPAPEAPRTAGELLGIDMTRPWPAAIEPLRALFERQRAAAPFEEEGFTLIEAPLALPGAENCVIGINPVGGRPARVLYGVRGQYAAEPPAGLEGYEWRGGPDAGYWVTFRSVE